MASVGDVISHWDTLQEGLQASVMEFYESLEDALGRRQVPNIRVSRVEHAEGGIGSARREYLRVEREMLRFDICAAPFGSGFFISWWLAEPGLELNFLVRMGIIGALFLLSLALIGYTGLMVGTFLFFSLIVASFVVANLEPGGEVEKFINATPFFGGLYRKFVKPATYYRIDTTLMFQEAVHNAVLEVVDAMTTTKGIRALGESQRKPIMRDFFARLP